MANMHFPDKHTPHGAVKAELQQWAQLVLLAEQTVLAAGIKVDFFRLLSQGRVCLQGLKFNE